MAGCQELEGSVPVSPGQRSCLDTLRQDSDLTSESKVRGSRSPGTYVSSPISKTKIPIFLSVSQANHPKWFPKSSSQFSKVSTGC